MGEEDKKLPKDIRPWMIKHGLYLELQKYEIDGRSRLGIAISSAKAALVMMFPGGKPDAAANLLIDRIIYKSMRLQSFERWDYFTGEAKPGTLLTVYLTMSNSLRADLTALMNMVDREKPPQAPDLTEYLAGLEKVNEGPRPNRVPCRIREKTNEDEN